MNVSILPLFPSDSMLPWHLTTAAKCLGSETSPQSLLFDSFTCLLTRSLTHNQAETPQAVGWTAQDSKL